MDPTRWHVLTLAEQLGNVASEVHRMKVWKDAGNEEELKRSCFRALELLDLSLSDTRWKKRLREICRSREVLSGFIEKTREFDASLEELDNYFQWFGILARLKR